MIYPSLYFSLLLALTAHFFGTALFPSVRLLAFAPLILLAMRTKPLFPTIWIALFCGLIVDLTNTGAPLGLYLILYSITTAAAYPVTRQLFQDKLLYLTLASIVFSVFFSIFARLYFHLLPSSAHIGYQGVAASILLSPLFNGLYAFFWFTSPALVYTFFSRHSKRGRQKPRNYYS